MIILSERVHKELKAEDGCLWYVPASDGQNTLFILKAPTAVIKALLCDCSLHLLYGKSEEYFCVGAQINDMQDAPIFVSGVLREVEAQRALIEALKTQRLLVFLFNELNVCVAETNATISEADASKVLSLIKEESSLYAGPFTREASSALDRFCFSIENIQAPVSALHIPTTSTRPT